MCGHGVVVTSTPPDLPHCLPPSLCVTVCDDPLTFCQHGVVYDGSVAYPSMYATPHGSLAALLAPVPLPPAPPSPSVIVPPAAMSTALVLSPGPASPLRVAMAGGGAPPAAPLSTPAHLPPSPMGRHRVHRSRSTGPMAPLRIGSPPASGGAPTVGVIAAVSELGASATASGSLQPSAQPAPLAQKTPHSRWFPAPPAG